MSGYDDYDMVFGKVAKPTKPSGTTPSTPSTPTPTTPPSDTNTQNNVNPNTGEGTETQPTEYPDASTHKSNKKTTTTTPDTTTGTGTDDKPMSKDEYNQAVNDAKSKNKGDLDTTNAELDAFISQANVIITEGGVGYDWSKYEGGYSQFLKDVESAKAQRQANTDAYNSWLGKVTAQQNYINQGNSARAAEADTSPIWQTNPKYFDAQREANFTKDYAILSLENSGAIAPVTIYRPAKVLDTSSKSSSKGTEGFNLLKSPEELTDNERLNLKILGFNVPKPAAPAVEVPVQDTKDFRDTVREGAVKVATDIEGLFSPVAGKLSEAGTGIYKKTQESGNILLIGGGILVSGAMGAGAGAFDSLTYLIRPAMWWNVAQGTKSLILSPVETLSTAKDQLLANPAYMGGYIIGSVYGGEAIMSAGESLFKTVAPKIPLVRDYYYANELKGAWVDTSLPTWDGVSIGGEANSALKILRQGKPTNLMPEFTGVLIDPAKTSITFGDLAQSLKSGMPRLTRVSDTLNFLRVAKPNYAFKPFTETLINPATAPLGIADLGLSGYGMGSLSGTYTFLKSAKPNYAFKPFTETLLNPASTPLVITFGTEGLGILSTASGAIKFYRQTTKPLKVTIGEIGVVSAVKGAYKFYTQAPSTGDLFKVANSFDKVENILEGRGGLSPTGKSPNRGFSRVDSGIVGKVTTKLDRDTTAFMKNAFKEPTPEIGRAASSSGASSILEPASTTNRAQLPNPYYPQAAGGASITIEQIYGKTDKPTRLFNDSTAKLKSALLSLDALNSKTSIKSDTGLSHKLKLVNLNSTLELTDVLPKSKPLEIVNLKTDMGLVTRQNFNLKQEQLPMVGLLHGTLLETSQQYKLDKLTLKKFVPPSLGRSSGGAVHGFGTRKKSTKSTRIWGIQSAERVKRKVIGI